MAKIVCADRPGILGHRVANDLRHRASSPLRVRILALLLRRSSAHHPSTPSGLAGGDRKPICLETVRKLFRTAEGRRVSAGDLVRRDVQALPGDAAKKGGRK